jgi:FMN reductase
VTRDREEDTMTGATPLGRRSIVAISAGLGAPSSTRLLTDRLTEATVRGLAELGIETDVETVELREAAHDIADNFVTGFANSKLRPLLSTVANADAVIAVTPTFNASYSGLFKSFFDVLDEGTLADRPVLIGATGGTARHSLVLDHALRPLFSYLHAVVAPTGVYAATEEWGGTDAETGLTKRIERAGRELAALVAAREPAAEADPFATATAFEDLLHGTS